MSGHLRKDLAPSGSELKHIGASIWEHIRLKFPQGEEAKRYNVLQKLAYLIVALVLLPLMLATGLAMSPGMDAGYPFLLEIFGGRQSARTIHFIAASGIVLFVVVHLVMVLITGRVEQPPLHDHRPLRDQASGGPGMSAKPKARPARLPHARTCRRRRYARRRLRQRAFRAALGQAHPRQGGGAHLCEPAGARLAQGACPRI